jgi:hypothetical protein
LTSPRPDPTLEGKCYIGVCHSRSKARIKRELVCRPGVYRVTDHGGHIKINACSPLQPVKGLRTVLVKDETTHFDVRYWDFATDAFRHATKKGHHPRRALGIMIHYLNNLFLVGMEEGDYLITHGLKRIQLERSVTDEQAHGWELPHVVKLKARR